MALNSLKNFQMTVWDGGKRSVKPIPVISEEPLSIRVQGNPYSVIMRTPGDELAHAAGFCLGEGIVDTPDDLASIGFCEGVDANVVTVSLKEAARKRISGLLDRRGFISQTSCGICGKEVVKDLHQRIQPIESRVRLTIQDAMKCLEDLSDYQPQRKKTRASHAAVIYGSDYQMLSFAEDVGRHNALDKAVGKLFLDNRLNLAALLILSSRISYELVQKAARARIPVVLSVSRPTSLAIELGKDLNMTMGCLGNDGGLYIFCGEDRLS
jgi:FdhD protein